MSLIYTSGNYINASTINAVSTEDAIFVKENLYNKRPSLPFRFTAKSSQYVELDMGSDITPTILSLINHNLLSSATIKIEADNDPPNWGSPSYSQSVTWREENLYFKISGQTFRWWRIFVTDASNPVYPQLGEAILHVFSSFSGASIQAQSEGDVFYTATQETFMGQDWDAELARKALLTLRIRKAETHGDSALEEIRAFLRSLSGSAGRFLVIPDDTTPECYYVKVAGSEFKAERIFHNIKDIRDWDLPLAEISQGINLL
jgi:hypothetical protein